MRDKLFLPNSSPVPVNVWVWVQYTFWDIVCYMPIGGDDYRVLEVPSGEVDVLPRYVLKEPYSFVPFAAVDLITQLTLPNVIQWELRDKGVRLDTTRMLDRLQGVLHNE